MVPWELVAGVAAAVIFPQHRGAILVAGAVVSVLKGNNKDNIGKRKEDAADTSGKIKRIKLEWEDITCTLLDKKGNEVKKLLQGVSGAAHPGRLLAILGPSGSGKTTLLNTLSAQVPRSKNLQLTGKLLVNGTPKAETNIRQAYVRQEDIFYSQLTVRETLLMAAKLQLPPDLPEREKEAYVDKLLQHLGLVSAADTIVGDAKARGISGGEKKRLSIACELIASPSVIFADEPTTGLDAFQAEKVMATLRNLAQEGHTVVCSIHQPRGSIYSMFDDLVLLAEGQLVYAGPSNEEAFNFFAELGHECPVHVNPAEFFSDLISIDFSSSETEKQSRERLQKLVAAFRDRQTKAGSGKAKDEPCDEGTFSPAEGPGGVALTGRRGGPWVQFQLLLRRAWRQTTRDKSTNFVRGAMNVTSALIFGSIFWRMGLGQTSIQDRMGLLQVAAINTAMASLTKTVNVFPKERMIVERERSKGSYSVGPYFLSKLMAELPIGALFPLAFGTIVYPMAGLNTSLKRFANFLGIVTLESFTSSALGLTVGSLVPSTEAALALGPSLMTVFIVFGGYYVNAENTPKIFQWIPSVSLIRWAFEGLCVNEFRGLKFQGKGPVDARNGEQVLERLSFAKSTLKRSLLKESQIMLFWYWSTFYLLRKKQPKFQPLLPPPAENDANDGESSAGGTQAASPEENGHVAPTDLDGLRKTEVA